VALFNLEVPQTGVAPKKPPSHLLDTPGLRARTISGALPGQISPW
jgi:hypothetical protein